MWNPFKKEKTFIDGLSFDEMLRIWESYRNLLANIGGKVMDESCLPASKEKIKKVILLLIASAETTDEKESLATAKVAQLATAYVMLSRFLPGVGQEGIDAPIEDLQRFSEALPRVSIENINNVKEKLKKHLRWVQKTQDEFEKLHVELKRAWLDQSK